MTTTAESPDRFTLMLLNGMLAGVEFTLEDGRTAVCVGDAAAFAHSPLADAAAVSAPTLFIPGEPSGPNFVIDLSAVARTPDADFDLEIYDGESPTRQAGRFQQPVRVGTLQWLLKPQHESWAGDTAMPSAADGIVRPAGRRRAIPFVVLALVLLSGLVLAVRAVTTAPTGRDAGGAVPLQAFQAALSTPNHQLRLLPGRDHRYYVLTADEREADWARQTLARAGFALPLRVSPVTAEPERLAGWLEQHCPGYLTLQLTDVTRPVLLVSAERWQATATAAAALKAGLLSQLPYAEQVSVETVPHRQVVEAAVRLLAERSIRYTREGSVDQGVRFVLSGELDDAARTALRTDLAAFVRRYGDRYVRFVLQFSSDWLKDKSYKYGADGYVQLSPRHRFFPHPL